MKKIKTYIPSGLLLLATLISASPAFAVAPVVVTGAEYHAETYTSSRGGTVEAVYDGSNERWELTAVPTDSVWMFVKWNDGNTENPRYISLGEADPMSKTYTAQFAVWVYQNCYSQEEYYNLDQTKAVNDTGRIVVTQPVAEGPYYLEAVPEEGYTFVQWADGSYENPRVFEPTEDAATTIYATFMETTLAQAKIDSWSTAGFKLISDESESITEDGVLGAGGAITVFYDGDVAFCGLPTMRTKKGSPVNDGIYTVSIPYSAELAGKKCHIVYKNASREPLAILDAYVPVLVNGNESDVVVPNSNTGVHVLDGGVATFATGQTLAELEIYTGGKVIIASEDTVSSVTIHRDGPNTVEVADAGALLVVAGGKLKNNNSNTINFDYTLDYDCYYPFSLPYTVSSSDVTYRSGHDADLHYVVNWYDGDARASGLSAWKPYYDVDYGYPGPVDFVGGRGYNIFSEPEEWNGVEQSMYGGVIRFPMTVDLTDGGETGNTVAVYKHSSTNMAYRNWNLIGLPYLSDYTGFIYLANDGVALEDDEHNPRILQYLTEPIYGFTDYSQEFVGDGDLTLKPFQAYFVQFNTDVENDVNELLFEAPASGGPASAPRKFAAAKTSVANKLKAGITLSQNGKSDHTGLFIGEQYTNSYDLNADWEKMIVESNRVKLYSLSGTQKLAYIAVPPAEGTGTLETVIPLGYDSAVVGQDMTFAMDAKRYPRLLEDENIYQLNLIDDVEGVTTNLLEDSYTCTAQKASDNTRFSLGIRYTYKAPQIATDICGTPAETTMRDGIYDLLGRLISTDARASRPGVYIVIENGKARKEVIR